MSKIKEYFQSLVKTGTIPQEPSNYDAETLKIYIDHLESENAALRERLEKAVELPCKVGDTVWFFDSDRILKKGKISMLQCKSDGNWKMRITYNLVSYKTVFDDYCNNLGIKYFVDRAAAEARLAELEKQEELEVKKPNDR